LSRAYMFRTIEEKEEQKTCCGCRSTASRQMGGLDARGAGNPPPSEPEDDRHKGSVYGEAHDNQCCGAHPGFLAEALLPKPLGYFYSLWYGVGEKWAE
jgi:hypothetical protein